MSNQANSLYLSAVSELQKILESTKATPVQKDAAEKALQDLTVLHGAYAIGRIEGRTAVPASLIIELNDVIAAVEVNPIGNALTNLNDIVSKARAIYQEEKGNLPTT